MIVTVTPNPALDRTLTVPCLAFNQVLRATASRLDWGGKGFNVSRALQALGVDSVAMGFVGGTTGQMLEHGLHSLGIATDFVQVAGQTRTNTVVVETDTGQYVKVNEAGPAIGAQEVAAFLERARARVRPGDMWVLSGSLPPGVAPDFYAQLTRVVQGQGGRTLLDSSGEALRLGCAASPHLAKPNAAEAEEMTGQAIRSDATALRATEFFLQQGLEWVALSLGADGLLLASTRQAVRARPPRVQASHSTGAGDALLAGLAMAMEQGLSPEEMARWGVAAGTAAAAYEGVSVGTRDEVKRLYEQVQVEQVNP